MTRITGMLCPLTEKLLIYRLTREKGKCSLYVEWGKGKEKKIKIEENMRRKG
jgi:hypothetical protein